MKTLSENKPDRFHPHFFARLLSPPCLLPANFVTAFPTQMLLCVSREILAVQVWVVEGQCCGTIEPCTDEEITGVWRILSMCWAGGIISHTIIKVQDIWLRIKTHPKRKGVPGRIEQKNIYSKIGSKKPTSPNWLEELKAFFNMGKEKKNLLP